MLDEYATKDVDDVKQGLLNHLADFFEVLLVNREGWEVCQCPVANYGSNDCL